MKPKKPALGKANKARRNAESAALNESMGKFKTGAHNTGEKRMGTRSSIIKNAIKDQED